VSFPENFVPTYDFIRGVRRSRELGCTPVLVQSISYGGEEHSVTVRRMIIIPVAHLPLKDDVARHALKLITGTRWTHYGILASEATNRDGSMAMQRFLAKISLDQP
jgi:hypothetical protein